MPNTDLPSWSQFNGVLPAERIELAPGGISPWQHTVELTPGGQLALYWTENGTERVRMFTREETCRLAEFLHDHKQAIFFPQQED